MFIEAYFPVRSDVALAIEYGVCGIFLYFFGRKFIQQVEVAEDLARKFNTWYGLALLAILCTLPEGVSTAFTLSTTAYEQSVDSMVGMLLGANAFSFLLIFLLNFFQKDRPFLFHLRRSLTVATAYNVFLSVLLGIAILTFAFPSKNSYFQNLEDFVLWIPLIFVIFWAVGMKSIFTMAIQEQHLPKFPQTRPPSAVTNALLLLVCGGLVIGASIGVTKLGQWVSHHPLVSETTTVRLGGLWVGTFITAVFLSLMKVGIVLGGVLGRRLDLVLLLLLGSTLSNLLVLVCGFFWQGSDFLIRLQPHLLGLLLNLLFLSVALSSLTTAGKRAPLRLGLEFLLMLILWGFWLSETLLKSLVKVS